METPTQTQTPKKHTTIWIISIILVTAVAITATYFYLDTRYRTDKQNLEATIDNLKTEDNDTTRTNDSDTDAVSYKTEIGDLEVTLPSSYRIIVRVDGNRGGAPGATLRIGEAKEGSTGVVEDNVYQWTEIDVTEGQNLAHATQTAKDTLTNEGYTITNEESTQIDGVDAMKIEASGVSYAGNRIVYVAQTDGYNYKITHQSGGDVNEYTLVELLKDSIKIGS